MTKYLGSKHDDNHAGLESLMLGYGGDDHLTAETLNFVSLYGGRGGDYLDATLTNGALLSGGRGRDILVGGEGNDLIKGGRGKDALEGGDGNDTLRGGKGHDVFVFRLNETGIDTIADFTPGKDKIVLSAKAFEGVTESNWFGSVVDYDGKHLSFKGDVFAMISGGVEIHFDDFLFVG